MEEYIYRDEYRGKVRELLILFSANNLDYRIFCEGQLLGIITSSTASDASVGWRTDYNVLKPVVGKIGTYIELCKSMEK